MPQHYLATIARRLRCELPASVPPRPTPIFSRSFSQPFPSAPLARIPIPRRTGCSSGITAGRIQSSESARGRRGASINRVSCSRFSSVGRGRGDGSDDVLFEMGERCGTGEGKKARDDEHRRDEASFAESSLSGGGEFVRASTTSKL